MDRKKLMQAVATRAFEARVELSGVCSRAKLSPTIAQRWNKGQNTPRLETIAKLERALDEIEQERAVA